MHQVNNCVIKVDFHDCLCSCTQSGVHVVSGVLRMLVV